MIKTYSEIILLPTYEERFRYLQSKALIGDRTFGGYRYLNQVLYNSGEWREIREIVILRDRGCDLGIEDREIYDAINVHHMNHITIEDILNKNPDIFNPEYLITTNARTTHKQLHYGGEPVSNSYTERSPHDTSPWRT